jgi:hypothetical protein
MDNKQEILSSFLIAFGGQLVTVTTSMNVSTTYSDRMEAAPILYDGILLEVDNDYVYLGESINEITSAIKKTHIIHICVKNELSGIDDLFNSMPDLNKDEIN